MPEKLFAALKKTNSSGTKRRTQTASFFYAPPPIFLIGIDYQAVKKLMVFDGNETPAAVRGIAPDL